MDPQLIKLLIMVEDRRFYYHFGIDPISILRALWFNICNGRYVQGGSTITQQLARTLYLDSKKNLMRKIKEAFIAVWLEMKYSKAEILKMYIESVYCGTNDSGWTLKGLRVASFYYFNKDLNQTSLYQKCCLVGLLKGPSIYNPARLDGRIRASLILQQFRIKNPNSGN